MEDRNIYFVFSSTPYRMGKMIRRVTREDYNHISIALDADLDRMYSFARRYCRTPLYGGFVQETLSRYHPKGKTAAIRVCRLPVTEAQYRQIEQKLEHMVSRQEQYLYNHFSAMTALFRYTVQVRDAYTCAEFAVSVLHFLGMPVVPGRFYSIEELLQHLSDYTVYEGAVYRPKRYDSAYYAKKPVPHPLCTSLRTFLSLLKRLKTAS